MDTATVVPLILSSTVIAAIISGIVSLIVAKVEYQNSLKIYRRTDTVKLLTESFDEYRKALDEAEVISPEMTGDMEHDCNAMLAAQFEAANKKKKLIGTTINRVKFLIPKDRAEYFSEAYKALEKDYISLKLSARIATGDYARPAAPTCAISIIEPENINAELQKYIEKANCLADELGNELGSILRSSLGVCSKEA